MHYLTKRSQPFRKYFFIVFLSTLSLQAIEIEEKEFPIEPSANAPWLMGPLLAPSGNVVPVGYFNVEPYFYFFHYTGVYALDWKTQSRPLFSSYALNVPIQFGLVPRVDLTIAPTAFFNRSQGKHSWGFGDLFATLGIQVWTEGKMMPNIKIALQELFPTGIYNTLDPAFLFTDGTGGGSYVTSLGLVFGKFFVVGEHHDFDIRFTTAYSVPSSVYLKGLNFYGGNPLTRGTLYPSQFITLDLGLEYSITKNWACALDVLYTYAMRSKFKGKNGEGLVSNFGGLLGEVSSQISLAPAIEYNWSQAFGIIFGAWFTVAGRNANIFRNAVIAINYYNK